MSGANVEHRLCCICLSSISDKWSAEESVITPCKGKHVFHVHCLRSWLSLGKSSCPCDRETLDTNFIDLLLDASVNAQAISSVYSERFVSSELLVPSNLDTFFAAAKLRIQVLEQTVQCLHLNPSTLQDSAKNALHWALSCSIARALHLQPRQLSPPQQFERLKSTLADNLRMCIGFLGHPYFQKRPSELNRYRLMRAVLSKRRALEKKRQLAVDLVDVLLGANFLTSLPSQERASLLDAMDGSIWHTLKLVVLVRLPPGSSELECAVQRSCAGVLDVMGTTWGITEA